MITHDKIAKYLLDMPESWLDFPFGENLEVYKFGRGEQGEGKMFALIEAGSQPVRLSLRCDPQLSKILRERYETVLTAKQLNKKHWITIICSGQLPDDEIEDLARLSHQLASAQ